MSIGCVVYFTIYLFSTWNNLVFLFLIHYQNVDKVLVSFESGPKELVRWTGTDMTKDLRLSITTDWDNKASSSTEE